MSLKKLSDHIAAHGRNGDSELVHMSKEEVQTLHGLASLHGTKLTRNPDTGLHEAFNMGGLFKTVLPIAAGIGGSMVGMPWLGALASAAMTTAETGDLSKGLMAGAGSYALGNLGGAAMGAGNQALANTAAQGATQAGTQAATQAAAQGATQGALSDAVTQAATQQAGQTAAQGALGGGLNQSAMQSSLGQSFPNLSAEQLAQVTSEGTPDLMAQRAAMLDRFGQANYTMAPTGAITQAAPIGGSFNPSAMDKLGALGVGDYMNIAKENPGSVLGAGTMLMNAFTPDEEEMPKDEWDGGMLSRANLAPDYYTRNTQRFATGGLASLSPKGFAAGGPVAFEQGGAVMPGMGNTMYPQANIASPMYNQPTQDPMERSVLRAGYEQMTDPQTGDQTFAQGGLAALSGGRRIEGPGDGTSDDVPASIGGVEPAALADGEYVVSADVVSHLGNGSTDAGVRRLDDMMARIRKARTGKGGIAPTVNASKFLPA